MPHSAVYVIRPAHAADAVAVRRLAALDSRGAPRDPVLLGEMDGEPVAALSLADGHVVADPFRPTAELVALLRVRAATPARRARARTSRPRLRTRLASAALLRRTPVRATHA